MINNLPTFEDVEQITQEVEVETPTPESEIFEQPQEEVETTETEVKGDPLAHLIYQTLVEQGYEDEDPEFDGNLETVDSKLQELPKKYISSVIESSPEFMKKVVTFATTPNVTQEEFNEFVKTFVTETSTTDISTLDGAREYLENHLKSQGLRPSAIQVTIDELEEENLLLEEATKIKSQESKKIDSLQENKNKENQEMLDRQTAFLQSVEQSLNEVGWSKTRQDVIRQTMPKANEIVQVASTKPKAYLQIIDFLSTFDGNEFKPKADAKAVSDTLNGIKSKLQKSGFSSVKTEGTEDRPSATSFDEFIKQNKII